MARTLTDLSLPPGGNCVVKLSTAIVTDETVIVTPADSAPVDISLLPTLTKSRQGLILARVVNTSPKTFCLPAATALGEVECRPDVVKCDALDDISPEIPIDLNNYPQTLTASQQEQLNCLLRTYSCVFAASKDDLGRTNILRHKINTENASPIKQPPRRIPLARRAEAEQLIVEMKRQGVILPSNSPWSSPVVLVRKKDGSLRFCVDYRRLNAVTKKDSYPLPRIDLTLEALGESSWFATLDLQSGYWQVEVDPADREKTAFTIGSGLYEFNVMPFGLTNAPATFQRLMEIVLEGMPYSSCLVYLDDVIVHAETFDKLMQHLELVFQRLQAAGLKLSPKKCQFCRREVKFLGHVVSAKGISVDHEKISAIRDWPSPRNKTEVQSFLGLCAYYRRFIRNFSAIAKPLTSLTEKRVTFEWSSACEVAFSTLKEKLTSAPVLCQPNEDDLFIVDTDASKYAWGAVLSQRQDGVEKVVEFYSKTLSRPERNYCVTRKELLALVKAVAHFQPYLLGRRFLLRTDHASLRWLMNFKEPEGQIARWIERLQQFDFEIQHRPGAQHRNADALSRRPCEEFQCGHCRRLEDREVIPAKIGVIRDSVQSLQDDDPTLRTVKAWLRNGSRPPREQISHLDPVSKAYWAMWSELCLKDDVAYRCHSNAGGTHYQLLLPESKKTEVLKLLHDSVTGGHLGVEKTMQKVKAKYYWVGCSNDVRDWCAGCQVCQERKGPIPRRRAPLQIYNVGAPFERLAVDILGPLPNTNMGNRYIVVVIDYFTKWPEAIAIKDQTAETVVEALIGHVFSRFGLPLQLHSDQGRNFESAVFREVLRRFGIEKTRTTPLHPQSDGMVERFNRTTLDYLSKFVSENQRDWDEYLPYLLLAYRSAMHEVTRQTPAMLTLGRELRLPSELMIGAPPDDDPESVDGYLENLRNKLRTVYDFTRQRLDHASRAMKERYDLSATANPFKVGDHVWLYQPRRRKSRCPKLQRDWEGPFEIVELLSDVTYKIRKSTNRKMVVVHTNRLAPYRKRLDHEN